MRINVYYAAQSIQDNHLNVKRNALDMNAPRRDTTELTNYLREALEHRGWSIRYLAGQAEMSSSGLSAMLRGKSQPTAETLARLAEVLDIDKSHLLRLSGYLNVTTLGELDPSSVYIAQRLDQLPAATREKAVEAINSVIDAFWENAQKDALYEEIKRSHPNVIAEAQENVKYKA